MYAAAAWLVWVLSQQITPEGLFRVLIGLVSLAFAAWAFGLSQSRPRMLSSILFLLGLAAAVGALALPFSPRAADGTTVSPSSENLNAEPYTAARLAALRSEGRAVFVNLTAAWCVSCLYNERVALSSKLVADEFKSSSTAYLVGDWTNQNPEISALLKAHGREGVPLYLYFPKGGGEPEVLPQILTETTMMETLGMTK
jgi:thiol:disulfide interchange protein DsbD